MKENESKRELVVKKIDSRYIVLLGFIIITIISFIIRYLGINFESGDMKGFLYRWFYTIKLNGGLKALSMEIGDYNAPYITILAFLTYLPVKPIISIKLISIIFDYVLAFSCVKLVKEVLKETYKEYIGLLVYILVILLPTVFLNSAWWGQCDSIYASFIVISLIYLIKERYVRSFVLLGISFAFKLQFTFVLPVYVLYYLSKRKFSKIYYFLIIPLTNLIACIPSVMFGKSIISCINAYLTQTSEYGNYISMNFPGIYNIFCKVQGDFFIPTPNEYLPKIMIIITGLIFFILALYVIIKKVKFDNKLIIETALCSIMIATFFLPHMHDRYMYAADIISIIYFIIYGKKKIYAPICINLCSLFVYIKYLYNPNFSIISIRYISVINLITLILLNISLWKNFKERTEDKKLIEDTSANKE